jgi:hypothetical protein
LVRRRGRWGRRDRGPLWRGLDLVDAYHQQFFAEPFDDPTVQVENPMPGEWESADAVGASGPPTIGPPTGDPRTTSRG